MAMTVIFILWLTVSKIEQWPTRGSIKGGAPQQQVQQVRTYTQTSSKHSATNHGQTLSQQLSLNMVLYLSVLGRGQRNLLLVCLCPPLQGWLLCIPSHPGHKRKIVRSWCIVRWLCWWCCQTMTMAPAPPPLGVRALLPDDVNCACHLPALEELPDDCTCPVLPTPKLHCHCFFMLLMTSTLYFLLDYTWLRGGQRLRVSSNASFFNSFTTIRARARTIKLMFVLFE
jgi:hypothetical protein